jgi:hypothetical protein
MPGKSSAWIPWDKRCQNNGIVRGDHLPPTEPPNIERSRVWLGSMDFFGKEPGRFNRFSLPEFLGG